MLLTANQVNIEYKYTVSQDSRYVTFIYNSNTVQVERLELLGDELSNVLSLENYINRIETPKNHSPRFFHSVVLKD